MPTLAAPSKPVLSADAVDIELATEIARVLRSVRRGLKRVSVEAKGGTVRLTGTVSSFYLRQMAAMTTRDMVGVFHIVDDIDVDWELDPEITVPHRDVNGKKRRSSR